MTKGLGVHESILDNMALRMQCTWHVSNFVGVILKYKSWACLQGSDPESAARFTEFE